jgi:ribonucleoside-diphosphate reductase alpha chain
MTERVRLPNCRLAETFSIEYRGLSYTATISRFSDVRIAEIFLSNHKGGSQADANARDSAVVCSLALQHGVPLDTIRKALLRDTRGNAETPLGAALDAISGGQGP